MLNVAIVGTGNIARAHIAAYRAFPERCRIVGLADIVPEKAEEKKRDNGLADARVYASHSEALADPSVDLVSVCTPPFCHAEIAVDCLRAGRHVVVEKPMAASLAECDAMIAAADAAGKVLSVIAQNRFRDEFMGLKAVLESGLAGPVRHARVDSLWWRGHCYYDLWWRGCWEKEGGGCTLNHAVHHIDMLGWMMGLPEKVTAMMANVAHDNAEVEDISIAAMRYAGGAVAEVTSSVVHHGEEQAIVFQGDKARISAPWKVHASTSLPNGFPERNPARERTLEAFLAARPPLAHTGHAGQLDDVMTAIETGRPPLVTGSQGRRALELITAIYKAAIEERAVTLPIRTDDPYYTVDGLLRRAPRFHEKKAFVMRQDGDITVGGERRP